ncbi:MAG: NAD(P)H-hydrate epimerase [Planctomycetota bacterium]|jgi:NAD(P)H-hydrate epimerase
MTTARPEKPETVREWDRRAIEEYGIPGIVLMENAGAGAAAIISRLNREEPERYAPPFVILCGPGNNGGDGYVVARHLFNSGFPVEVYLSFDPEVQKEKSDAGLNLAVIRKMGIAVETPAPDKLGRILQKKRTCTIIDGLLGTGLSRPLEDPYLTWVDAIAESGQAVIALDIPSGLDAASGEVHGRCAVADHTITFAAPKTGLCQGSGPDFTGRLHVVKIGIPQNILKNREKHPG